MALGASVTGTASDILGQTLFSFDGGRFTVGSVFVIGIILVGTFVTSRYFRRFLKNEVFERRDLDRSLQFLLLRFAHYSVLILGVLVALNVVGIQLTSLVALAGVAGLALGFGLQTIVSNFVSGMILMAERSVKVGDIVEVSGRMGEVVDIQTRSTTIETFDNVAVVVPNEDFIAKEVVNWSADDPKVRAHVEVGVAYGSDVQKVKEVLLEVAREDQDVLRYPEPQVWFESFGDSSLNFKLLAWVPSPQSRKSAISRMNFEIDRRFREEDIEIPFPQRDVHMKEE